MITKVDIDFPETNVKWKNITFSVYGCFLKVLNDKPYSEACCNDKEWDHGEQYHLLEKDSYFTIMDNLTARIISCIVSSLIHEAIERNYLTCRLPYWLGSAVPFLNAFRPIKLEGSGKHD